jgi:quercetin dioxygenase-like cupin family protein
MLVYLDNYLVYLRMAGMPFVRVSEAVVHDLHGTRFTSYIRPAGGARDLAAWRCEIPAGEVARPHVISHEETFYVLSGRLLFTIGDETAELGPGDAAAAPAGSTLAVGNPAEQPAQMWLVTRVGLTATMADGTTITPPWAN